MPPHHGDVNASEVSDHRRAAIALTDADDQDATTGVGEGPWVPRPEDVVTDEVTAVTRPVRRI